MTNKNYNKLLRKLATANKTKSKLLTEAEEEFKRRYKVYQSDIDFDWWIDQYHYGTGYCSIEDIDANLDKNDIKKYLKKNGSTE